MAIGLIFVGLSLDLERQSRSAQPFDEARSHCRSRGTNAAANFEGGTLQGEAKGRLGNHHGRRAIAKRVVETKALSARRPTRHNI